VLIIAAAAFLKGESEIKKRRAFGATPFFYFILDLQNLYFLEFTLLFERFKD